MDPWIKCRFLVSRPLDGERVDLLGADVAGEDQRIVRGDAHWRRRPAQVLQADDGFRLAIGDADAHRRRGRTSGYNEHRFQIPGRDPADQGGGKQFSLFPRPEIEKRKLPRGLHGHQFVLTDEYARAKPIRGWDNGDVPAAQVQNPQLHDARRIVSWQSLVK
jgi:hypothetical protein